MLQELCVRYHPVQCCRRCGLLGNGRSQRGSIPSPTSDIWCSLRPFQLQQLPGSVHQHGQKTGLFHIIALGVYFVLEDNIGSNFQGLWKHGGTGPFLPVPNSTTEPWAHRLSFISYPPQQMYSGNCCYCLAQNIGSTNGNGSF